MKILRVHELLLASIPFLNAGRTPGGYYRDELPVYLADVDQFPAGLSAIIATGDLQGRVWPDGNRGTGLPLLGERLPDILCETVLPQLELSPSEVGVLLAGDFYTVPDLSKRGGSGDVRDVWTAFGRRFAWVAGVAGNHDTFGESASRAPIFRSPLHFLDQSTIVQSGLAIAGISGIVGNPNKPWRKSEEDFEDFILSLADAPPSLLLMHDGPDVPELGYRGSSRIRAALEHLTNTLVVRGHTDWRTPLGTLSHGLQVLNVEARVVILKASSQDRDASH
jgi:3',5'-cyclic-AMP phosphodiesterase